MSAIATPQDLAAKLQSAQQGERVLVNDLDWPAYRDFIDGFGTQRIRFTYDQGSLEIMPTSRTHELITWLVGRMIETWALLCKIPFSIGGAMTFGRADLQREMAPDNCFWISNVARVRGLMELDFTKDPPPDLVIESEVTHSVVNRLDVLAALKVSEVWRCDVRRIQVGLLQSDGQYQWGERSDCFPTLPITELPRFLRLASTKDHSIVLEEFRTWAQQQVTA